MKANYWMGANRFEVKDVPDSKILNPRDAIVRVTSTAICGSDLHLYDGYMPTMEKGDILGHEFMGEVVEVGPRAASNVTVGDRVVVPGREGHRHRPLPVPPRDGPHPGGAEVINYEDTDVNEALKERLRGVGPTHASRPWAWRPTTAPA